MLKELTTISRKLNLRVSKRARRMALRLDTKNRMVHLVVPRRVDLDRAYDFALQNRDWIREKLATLPDRVDFIHGSTIPVLGRDRTIHITYDPSLKKTDIFLTRLNIYVLTNQKDPTARITRFLKTIAKEAITELALDKAGVTRKKVKTVSVRDTSSRWGSCASDGSLSFCWRLIFAPRLVLDYVVAHEIAHLSHMNHGKRFWELCERLSEDYDFGKTWIGENGHDLMRYGAKK